MSNIHDWHDKLGIWIVFYNSEESFLISPRDYERIIEHRWRIEYARKDSFSRKSYKRVGAKIFGINVKLHRFILNATKGSIIDHINKDTFDNRRVNLRFVTTSQNQNNRAARKNSTSIYKGVFLNKKTKKWVAQIKPKNKKIIHLGVFNTEIEAHRAYKKYITVNGLENLYDK